MSRFCDGCRRDMVWTGAIFYTGSVEGTKGGVRDSHGRREGGRVSSDYYSKGTLAELECRRCPSLIAVLK